jgi:hypothetical protein
MHGDNGGRLQSNANFMYIGNLGGKVLRVELWENSGK